jgi:hypothetical protein
MEEYITTFSWTTALLVFVMFVVMDILYAYYTISVTKVRPLRASTAAAVMYFVNALGVLNYINNPLYLIPIALGSFIGTYAMVKREEQKEKQKATSGSLSPS